MVKKKVRKKDDEAGEMIGFSMSTFLDMADRSGLISIPEAAQIRGTSRAAIQHLIERGRLTAYEVFGRTMVNRREVENFERKKSGPKVEGEE
ncbi:MAG TPA: helix-turn-helix domain-containing protein [Pyrinomonadaceae bacterium]|nr:helix-turn-helix domain-containing protein [Pyrinomonadaceae bacterium]